MRVKYATFYPILRFSGRNFQIVLPSQKKTVAKSVATRYNGMLEGYQEDCKWLMSRL